MQPWKWASSRTDGGASSDPFSDPTKSGSIVIAHQHREDWKGNKRTDAFQEIYQAAKATGRPIVIRFHPNYWGGFRFPEFDGYEGRKTQGRRHTYPLAEDLSNAWCLATHDSNAAVDAAMAGVPVFTLGKSMAEPVKSPGLDFERPARLDREPWMRWLAYQQWTAEEIGNGDPFRYLLGRWEEMKSLSKKNGDGLKI